MKKLAIVFLSAFFFFPASLSAQNSSPEEMFKKSFPKNNFESISETPIKGLYEVYTGSQIYYYMPEGDFILTGNIITKDGKNLTSESGTQKISKKMTSVPLEKALKIGSGKTDVVEFIDPNCHYCRLSFNFFAKRKKDVTLYVFFYPLSEDSAKTIRHILCAKDKTKAYDDALSGKLDNKAPLNLCSTKESEEMLKEHRQISEKIGVRATPMFYIKGQVVPGFDQPALEKLLKD